MEQAYPPGGENPSWGEVPEKNQQQQQKPPAMSQPTDQYYSSSPNSGAWQTGICGCCSDMGSYCWACWCPCVQFGRNFEIIEEGNRSCLVGGGIFYLIHQFTCCGAMYSSGYRRKLRLKYGLPEEPCGDFCTECCCLPCSLAQQTRELKRLKYGLPEQPCGDCCTECCCNESCCLPRSLAQQTRELKTPKYGLPEQPCGDCCTESCCLPRSLAQQTGELKSRGVDPNLGWKWEPNREAHLNSVPQVPKMEK
jgi:Cys-rich protein (TIGR01571 family)